jgi:two-component system, cell cycle response regulator DivK
MTILLVEDHVLNRRLAEVTLSARGHRVLQADSVEAARAALAQQLPDVVLMDIELPGGGGVALMQEIRSLPAMARLPIIAVTALAMQGDRERLLRAGFDAYISKPIDVATFGPEIESLVSRSG